jgi:DNA adenine methylase
MRSRTSARTRAPLPPPDAARTGRRSAIPSLVKWTGSKRSQAHAIRALFPACRRYFEPFLGGGALLYLAGHPGAVAGDAYAPLVGLWERVRDRPEDVIRDYQTQWTLLQQRLPDHFYDVRARFNRERDPLDLSFLMRTCVNGIVRFNAEGEFNNSFHLSRRGMEPARFAEVVKRWHPRLDGVRLVAGDFEDTLSDAAAGDFVYLDPPYAGNRQRYAEALAPARLFRVLADLNSRGVKWALSFDGLRGGLDLTHPVPRDLFRRHVYVHSGRSAVNKVLNGGGDAVRESLYLNY